MIIVDLAEPINFDIEPSMDIYMGDQVGYVSDDALDYAAADPIPWDEDRDDSFVAALLAPPPVTIKQEHPSPLHGTVLTEDMTPRRRSARLASAPRPSYVKRAATPSVVDVTSSEEDDEDDDEEDGDTGTPPPKPYEHIKDKKERRRVQVREASSRRRVKLKAEEHFMRWRIVELDEDQLILQRHFPLH